MVTYVHGPLLIVDQTGKPVPTAAGKVYALTDSSFATPLPMTDMAGVTLVDAVTNAYGYLPQIQVEDHSEVKWKSGDIIQSLRSFGSVLDEANAAKTAAQAAEANAGLAQQAAEDALQQVEDLIENGGGGGGVTAHSQLSGLLNDDHTQYFNQTRGDARYYTKGQVDTKINDTTTATSAADRSRINHTGTQAQSTVTGLVAALTTRIQSVAVSTGSEARPSGSSMVLWVGGVSQPVNMAIGDVWLAGEGTTPGDDVSPPSIPTGVAVSAISSSTATVTWSASSDNVAVTGYEVQLNGTPVGTPTGTSFGLTGLTPETAYTVRVRARDAVPNWSALSTSAGFTTAPVGAAVQHSVFGSAAHPGTLTVTSDSPVTVATSFYTTTSGANGWTCVGGRLYVPALASVPASCTMSIWIGDTVDLGTTPAQTATLSGITAGQWNEVEWPAAVAMTPGTKVFVGYFFTEGLYLATASTTSGFIQSVSTTLLYEAEGARSKFRYNDAPFSQDESTGHYGIDLIVQEA